MTSLALLVPSRGRPENIVRLMQAMEATCRGDTTLIVGLDADDPRVLEYPSGPVYEVAHDLHFVTGWINYLARYRHRGYDALGHIGDDNVPETPGWDIRILQALERTPFAFGNDLYPREPGSLPCHIFMRSQVVEALGYMAPPAITHIADLAWREWGKACGITYLDDVIIEHLHWSNGKAPMDAVYQAIVAIDAEDNACFRAYAEWEHGLREDIAKITAVM